eukprot:Skav232880  [mRNA]  locus=scaffold1432:127979:129000:- [translate_table: standard]
MASSVKKEHLARVKVKKERVDEQEQTRPGNTQVATRRRLTRRDWPQEGGAQVNVKKERIDKHKATDWLKVRNRRSEADAAALEAAKAFHAELVQPGVLSEPKALELRELHRLQPQVKPVSTLAELPVLSPKVPCPGVNWEQRSQQWHAYCRIGGVQRNFYIRPQDHSEEELERSFKKAVNWKKKQEKEKKQKAAKPKEPPVKKRRKCGK